jgi:hypothetical protein
VVVLQQQWAVLAYSLHLVRVGVWHTIAGGVNGFLACRVAVLLVTAKDVASSDAIAGSIGGSVCAV